MSQKSLKFGSHPDGGYTLSAEMFVGLPREQVFNFFADARELERITPPWLNFSIRTPSPVVTKRGLRLD